MDTSNIQKVATEVAENDFARFLDAMDLEFEQGSMAEEERNSFSEAKRKMISAIERGQLGIDDKGQPVLQLSDGQSITFREPTGAAFMSMDNRKKDASVAKLVSFMAEMTSTPPVAFSKMKSRDFKLCQTIVTLFLA